MPRGVSRYDEARLQGRLWTPRTAHPASVLQLWLDAADISTISGATGVSAWRDKSGNGNDASQGTGANQPTWSPSGLNGRPCLTVASGSAQFMTGNVSLTAATLTAFVIASIDGAGTSGRIVSLGLTGANDYNNPSYTALYYVPNSTTVASYRQSQLSTSTVTTSVPFCQVSLFDGTNNTAYLNGTGQTPVANALGSFNTSNYVLAKHINAAEYLTGRISEIVILNMAANTQERQRMEGYLGWKWWGESNLLPGTHPYKLRPPLIGD